MNCQNEVFKKINTALGKLDKPLEQGDPEQDHPWLVFSLGNTMYAISAGYVLRAAVLYELIPFVDTPAFCPGIMWSRDGMIRLLDLRALFGQGDYRSAMISESDNLPVIIVIELDGKKRGVIVDKIVEMEYFSALIEDVPHENCAQSPYIRGVINDRRFVDRMPVIDPDSFIGLKFEPQHAKIDWNARIDMRLLAEKIRKNGSSL